MLRLGSVALWRHCGGGCALPPPEFPSAELLLGLERFIGPPPRLGKGKGGGSAKQWQGSKKQWKGSGKTSVGSKKRRGVKKKAPGVQKNVSPLFSCQQTGPSRRGTLFPFGGLARKSTRLLSIDTRCDVRKFQSGQILAPSRVFADDLGLQNERSFHIDPLRSRG